MNTPRAQKCAGRGAAKRGEPQHDIRPTGHWLRPLDGHWTRDALNHLELHARVARVTVVALRGSGPREPGATMLVDAATTRGTIGGGHLEHHAVRLARDLLEDARAAPVRVVDLVLGPELGQCCGGRVELWLERLTRQDRRWLRDAARATPAATPDGRLLASRVWHDAPGSRVVHRVQRAPPGAARITLGRAPRGASLLERLDAARLPLWIFGAGHVGQALVRLLAGLDCFDITWIDSRAELLPADTPECVTVRAAAVPVAAVTTAPSGTHFVVLTHDHALDYDLCRAVLGRGNAAWLGLIGSASKAARFRSRLRRDGLAPHQSPGLTCPIGVPGIAGKQPVAIAIAVAAQLLQHAAAISAATRGDAADCGGDCGACGARREHSA